MSWDVELRMPPCPTCGRSSVDVEYDGEFTYNYRPALEALGFPSNGELHGAKANDVTPAISAALAKLLREPRKYGEMIRGGGEWGTADSLTVSLRDLLNACLKYPGATIVVDGRPLPG
jgi:hypothetical protein